MLNRRHALRHTARLALPTALAAAPWLMGVPVRAQAARKLLRISTPAVPDDWHARMWTVFRDELEKSSPGEFEVQIHLNGSLFRQGAEPVAMARGNLEVASISAFDIARTVPEFSVFTAGYMVRDPEHLMKIFASSVGAELLKAVTDKMAITVLSPLYLGTRQLNLRAPASARPVRTPGDLKGLKLRMPTSREWLFLGEALGATPTPLAFGEVYLALKTGTIDAQDNPLPTVRSAKFFEVTKQVVLTSHLVDSLFIVMADKFFDSLSPVQRDRVRAAAAAAARFNNEQRLRDEAGLLDFLRQQGLSVSTPDVAAFRRAVQDAYLKSDLAKAWPPGLVERLNAVR
jgi:tripartite ATP-independent transporter DctP family solute receptor